MILRPNVQIPSKLRELYEFGKWRYKIMHGGRGGAKSHSVARVLLDLGARQKLRILCVREIQKSMRDSVHRLLRDLIVELGLESYYKVTDTEIRGRNGTLFSFTGLQSHTADTIKSFEGVDIVWIEEAQSISRKSLEVLTPTIRKEGSEIWMTLNPDVVTDPVWQDYIEYKSPRVLTIEINWSDNPWFPAVLDDERREAKRKLPKEDYERIWEGKPARVAAGSIYRHEVKELIESGRQRLVPYDPMLPVHTVWDLGWADSMVILMVQAGPQDVRIINYIEESYRTVAWYVSQLEKLPYRWGTDFLPHDGSTRNAQTGMSTEEVLQSLGRTVQSQPHAQDVEEGIKSVRMMMPRVYIDEDKCGRLMECLKYYKRRLHERTGEPMGPLHDEYSHGADGMRYLAYWLDDILAANTTEYNYVEAPPQDWRM